MKESHDEIEFTTAFRTLTGMTKPEEQPFPWQRDLYETWFSQGKFPDACTLPTGLGKTSVVAIWLIALAKAPDRVPRRLVYVVNRRTVVDQTTTEAEKMRRNAIAAGLPVPAISTLRGQFADNREWSADPSRPAVICGTVDMIGSRLLFSGYGCGFKSRPLHAGFLGQDVLLIHDEAHLEPAFQKLIKAIECEQRREGSPDMECRRLRVMELTATTRGRETTPFGLTDKDGANPIVRQRIHAKKGIVFHPVKAERGAVAAKIGDLAAAYKDSGKAILVFVRTIDDVKAVEKKIAATKAKCKLLTGTIRGKERDELVGNQVFRRFRPEEQEGAEPGTVYLICTSAGKVGIDISGDHLVCDLTPFDSEAQRFGRVNRRGGDDRKAHIDIVHEKDRDPKKKEDALENARWETLELLQNQLPPCDWDPTRQDASPEALRVLMGKLSEEQQKAAFTPQPVILPTSDILFDAWALTTIRDKLPGRPKVEPYLHGLAEWQLPETLVAWREEVEKLQPEYMNDAEREERKTLDWTALAQLAPKLLEDYPLKPHELLRELSHRAFKQFEAMAKRCPDLPVWLVNDDGEVEVLTVADLADKDEKERIEGVTILLPPSAGGLEESGMFNGAAAAPAAEKASLDVADQWFADKEKIVPNRVRLDENAPPAGMRLIRRVPLPGGSEETEPEYWYWFELGNEGGTSAKGRVEWCVHVKDVEDRTAEIVDKLLPLDGGLRRVVKLAAKFHDHGKRRKLFQLVLGNSNYRNVVLAKSGKKGGRVEERYRHEFGSLLDVQQESEFQTLPDDEKDLMLHLIATHHGRARPHFPPAEAFDPDHPSALTDGIAREVPRRFARLQRKYGRWGLAYLESLLRAADWAASANPSRCLPEDEK